MNRIASRTLSPEVYDRLSKQHEQLTSLLRGSVPPSVLGMFPKPAQSDQGQVQWHSYLAGQPKSYSQLSKADAERVLSRLQQRLDTIDQAIGQLEARQTISAAQATELRQTISEIPQDALVVVDDEPLVLYWRSALGPNAPMPLLPLAALASLGVASAANANPTNVARRRCSLVCLGWLLGFVLFLLLLFALWWFFCPLSPRHAPSLDQAPGERLTTEDLTITIPPPTVIDPAELWQPVRIPEAPPKPCPAPVACPEPEPVPEPEPEPEPEPAPKVEPVAKPKPPAPQQKPVTVSTAKEFCPDQRPPELAPEVILVFDHSGSMRLNIKTTAAQEQQLMRSGGGNPLMQLFGIPNSTLDLVDREPTRMTVARQSVIDVVNRLPSDVNAGLVTFSQCPNAQSRGFFTPGQRGALLNQIRRLQPEGGTPLADAVLLAGQMVDGVNRESMIIVLTDGQESCGGDPCFVAQQLAAAKPHLTINVVDIGNSGGGDCIAAAGRGKVYSANSVAELNLGLQRAIQDVLGPSDCKP